jgi:hypothetical protein
LRIAAEFSSVACARFLLQNGAKPDTECVLAAFRCGHIELFRTLSDLVPTDTDRLLEAGARGRNVVGFRWLLETRVESLQIPVVRRLVGALKETGCQGGMAALLAFAPEIAEVVEESRGVSGLIPGSFAAAYAQPTCGVA